MSAQSGKPKNSTWTDEQWRAITERGHHLLVAAAAGSGKTAVLVERIIRTVSDEADPVDIDRILVVTFTNAAAAEMRHRLREALEKALAAKPHSRHLRKQLALVGRALITTLHSFCLEVVRRYVHLTELDPGFRIANETEAALLRQEALENVLEIRYGESAEDSPFWQLADRFGGERGDDGLARLVHRLYDFSRSHPWPELWLKEAAFAFRMEGQDGMRSDHPWLSSIEADVKLELEGIADALRTAYALAIQPLGPSAYAGNLKDDLEGVQRLSEALAADGWRGLERAAAQGADALAFGRLKPQRGDADAAVTERVKKLRKESSDRWSALKEQLLSRTLEEYAEECRLMAPMMEELARLTLDFGASYRQAKLAKGLVDFSDLEHMCLDILRDGASAPDKPVPTEAALGYREQFVELYVDEYQDTNAVQETILQLVSRGETAEDRRSGNRFMVGDVKQSIYRFRLAEPELFLHKSKTYRSDPFASEEHAGMRIDLARNFRSRREVVDAVNFIFRQTMHEEAAEIEYDERAELVCGASYPDAGAEHDMAAEVVLIDRSPDAAPEPDEEAAGDEALELEAAELEARAIGRRIMLLTGAAGKEPFRVFDKALGVSRPIAYRDIVILLRADKAWAPAFIEELRLFGIPAHAELGGGYFDAVEVETVLSLLQTIDNPLQDIPLAAALRSPVFGFSGEELAQIRMAGGRGVSFYEAIGRYSNGNESVEADPLREKVQRFLTTLEPWRTAARQGTLADLILRLYRETGYFDFVGGLPGGAQRQANLRALYDRARQFEATSFQGLFRFLRFIERLRDSGADLAPARAVGEQENVVRIMSVHKSKGLEFPVVFAAGLGKSFNRGDEREPFLIHKSLGFGPRFIEPEQGFSYPTLPFLAIRRRLRAEALAEEMRVLYVALTRAKEKLVLVGSVKALQRRMEQWSTTAEAPGSRIPAHAIHRGACFLDWIVPAMLRHPDADGIRERFGLAATGPSALYSGSRWVVAAASPDDFREVAAGAETQEPKRLETLAKGEPVPDDWTTGDGDVARRLGWTDPHPLASLLYAKTSVTEWKRRLLEEEDAAEFPAGSSGERSRLRTPAKRPRFLSSQGLNAVERGVAYHAVMQHLPLARGLTQTDVEALLSNMVLRELITDEQRQAVDAEAIRRFLESEAGGRLLQAKSVYRELPFTVGLPAKDVYAGELNGLPLDEATGRDLILVQGIIDCLFEDEGGLVLVDYKTDALYGERLDELTKTYRLQLGVYAKAVETSLGRPVADSYLYFFDGARTVKL